MLIFKKVFAAVQNSAINVVHTCNYGNDAFFIDQKHSDVISSDFPKVNKYCLSLMHLKCFSVWLQETILVKIVVI